MSYAVRVLIASLALLLLAAGIWANLSSSPLLEMRGAWVKHAMRGPAGVL
jgi:hypothetical protein